MKTNFKKMFLAISLVVCLVVSCGCAQLKTGVKVNADGSADVNMTFMVDDNVLSMMGGEAVFHDMKADIVKAGYKAKLLKQNSQTGYQYTCSYKSLSAIVDQKASVGQLLNNSFAPSDKNTKLFTKTDGFFADTYAVNANVNLEKLAGSSDSDDSSASMMQAIMAKIDFSFDVELPVKPTQQNATKVSDNGKKMTWTLAYGKENPIQFTFKAYHLDHLLMVGIPVVVVILALIILLIVMLVKKNKRKKAQKALEDQELLDYDPVLIEGEVIDSEEDMLVEDAEEEELEADDLESVDTVQTADDIGEETETPIEETDSAIEEAEEDAEEDMTEETTEEKSDDQE